jgi:hypothetical protein
MGENKRPSPLRGGARGGVCQHPTLIALCGGDASPTWTIPSRQNHALSNAEGSAQAECERGLPSSEAKGIFSPQHHHLGEASRRPAFVSSLRREERPTAETPFCDICRLEMLAARRRITLMWLLRIDRLRSAGGIGRSYYSSAYTEIDVFGRNEHVN